MKEALQDHTNELQETISTLKQGMSDQSRDTMDWSRDMSSTIHDCGHRVIRHLTNDIKEDQPTGEDWDHSQKIE